MNNKQVSEPEPSLIRKHLPKRERSKSPPRYKALPVNVIPKPKSTLFLKR